jgi:hypothetical protein
MFNWNEEKMGGTDRVYIPATNPRIYAPANIPTFYSALLLL